MTLPYLSLRDMTIDPALVARIPRHLAYYHVAIPVAIDEDQVTLVMAYANNRKVIGLFEELFGLKVVPVSGDAVEIRAMLDQVYPSQSPDSEVSIVSWSAEIPEATLAYAHTIASAFASDAICLPLNATNLDGVASLVHEAPYTLAVLDHPVENDLETLLRSASASMLLLHGKPAPFRRALLILQGHSPDARSIALTATIASAFQASVTLLKVAAPQSRHVARGLAPLLDSSHVDGRHLSTCIQQISETSIPAYLKLRQGNPETETVNEFLEGDYDLIAIAVEAYGAFIARILSRIQSAAPERYPALLAVKPQR